MPFPPSSRVGKRRAMYDAQTMASKVKSGGGRLRVPIRPAWAPSPPAQVGLLWRSASHFLAARLSLYLRQKPAGVPWSGGLRGVAAGALRALGPVRDGRWQSERWRPTSWPNLLETGRRRRYHLRLGKAERQSHGWPYRAANLVGVQPQPCATSGIVAASVFGCCNIGRRGGNFFFFFFFFFFFSFCFFFFGFKWFHGSDCTNLLRGEIEDGMTPQQPRRADRNSRFSAARYRAVRAELPSGSIVIRFKAIQSQTHSAWCPG